MAGRRLYNIEYLVLVPSITGYSLVSQAHDKIIEITQKLTTLHPFQIEIALPLLARSFPLSDITPSPKGSPLPRLACPTGIRRVFSHFFPLSLACVDTTVFEPRCQPHKRRARL